MINMRRCDYICVIEILLISTFVAIVQTRPSVERCNRILNNCPRRFQPGPVCGSDGRTYSSECKLLRKACKKGRNLRKQHDGTCGINDVIQYTYKVNGPYTNYDVSESEEDVRPEIKVKFDSIDPPSNINSEHSKGGYRRRGRKQGRVRRKNRRNHRKNSSSSGEEERSKQYDKESNEKRHKKPNRHRRRHTHIPTLNPTKNPTKQDRPTGTPHINEMKTNAVTVRPITKPTASTMIILPTPDCRILCSPFLPKAPLCASNGKTYSSLCELELDVCILRDQSITVEYDGPCSHQAEGRIRCPQYCPLVFQPVCGNNGKTYPSSCWLSAVSCQKPDIKLLEMHTGRCKTKIEVKDPERPICKRTCPTEFKRVCGSDGMTYANECLLKLDSCKDPGLTVVMQGPCPPTDNGSEGSLKRR